MDFGEKLIITRPLYFKDSSSNCGYCHNKKENKGDFYSLKSWNDKQEEFQFSNSTVGFQSERMSIEMYDRLCNMGCRRSGNFLYKCDMLRNCCRLYTIRTTKEQVNIDKDLKKSLTRFKKHISGSDESQPKSNSKAKHQQPYNFVKEIKQIEKNSTSFTTQFEPAVFTEEKYNLFVRFQEKIHKDFKNSQKSFKRFLCDSPFPEENLMGTKEEWEQLNNWKDLDDDEYITRLGPTHECYYFENKLIAFAVIDFMPSGLSSVYFVWDPDYAKWSLGKVSALHELAISTKIKNGYYYLGYYISDCSKMSYKGKYGGEILDVCSRNYVPLSKLEPYIKGSRFFVMNSENQIVDEQDSPLEEVAIDKNMKIFNLPSIQTDILQNIVENIYGVNGKAMLSSNSAAKKLNELGIPFSEEDINGIPLDKAAEQDIDAIFKDNEKIDPIPNVLPGLVPLYELLEMIISKEINKLNNSLLIFDTELGGMRFLRSFDDENPSNKRIICDTVRFLGLNNALDTIIII